MQSVSTMIASGGDASVDTRAANSYDFVRFCAASAVLFSHHFDLSGLPEPQVPGFGEDFGEVAVELVAALALRNLLPIDTGLIRLRLRPPSSVLAAPA